MHEHSAFLTLTYDDQHIPEAGTLVKSHVQDFMHALRKHCKRKVDPPCKIRYFLCGEYGEQLERPHYHIILFGYAFEDKRKTAKSQSGEDQWTSETLDSLWQKGKATIAEVTYDSAAYVAGYCVKKITGDQAESHYGDRLPEFIQMSLKPGIGKAWLAMNHNDVYPKDQIVIDGKEIKPPKYYDLQYSKSRPRVYAKVRQKRIHDAQAEHIKQHTTPERLATREELKTRTFNAKKRNLGK